MKNFHRHFMLAATLATSLAVIMPFTGGASAAEESATVPTNPGFKPDTGQINPGVTRQAPSKSDDFRKIPTHAEALAALMAPDDPNPAIGPEMQEASSGANNEKPANPDAGGADPTTASQGLAAVGGPLAPGAPKSGAEATPSAGGSNAAGSPVREPTSQAAASRETTGLRSAGDARGTSEARPAPIGATGQTMPSLFSKRNDVLDRVPIMALPMRLSDQERQRIYQAVMADKSQPAAGADALAPASILSTEQALNETHALPDTLKDIELLKGLQYVKAKNKVLLVTPASRIVVDEIAS